MSQSAASQGPAGQESPPRSVSDRSGSGGGKSTNKEESGCESSRNNGYDNKRYPNREAGQHPSGPLPQTGPTGNGDESSHYHSFINRKADGIMDAGDRPQSLSPSPNGATSKLSNNSLSPKSQQLMDSDSDDVGDSDHNSHPTGTESLLFDSDSIFSSIVVVVRIKRFLESRKASRDFSLILGFWRLCRTEKKFIFALLQKRNSENQELLSWESFPLNKTNSK